MQNVEHIKKKSSTLHLGMDLEKFNTQKQALEKNIKPLILWNHRWEHDKNPEEFFYGLYEISKDGIEFDLAVLGQEFKNELPVFTEARKKLKKHIVQFGYTETFDQYAKWLWKADILPITSKQDFFGGSIMEAVYCSTLPLLPKRLTYPELFLEKENPYLFYNKSEYIDKLKSTIINYKHLKEKSNLNIAIKYDWSNMASIYDDTFLKIIS
jgi:glycosyltransferase involved in cell wall biosynthesis